MKSCKECGDTYYAKGYCIKHYFKSRRKTTRQLIPEGAQCTYEGCERAVRAKMKCAYHYDRDRRIAKGEHLGTGSGWQAGRPKKEVVGYRAAHIRVEQIKGKASTYDCVKCGNPAQEWALDPTAVHTYEDGEGRVWSMNVDDYYPMCCSDHRKLDRQPDEWYIALWLDSKI